MKVEALTDDSIIVELTDDDMKSLNITYEEMDYANVETKRVIWTVLSRARRTLGRELDTNGRLFVEAMRQDSGGCVLFFTVEAQQEQSRPKRYLVKPQAGYITCEFTSLDDVFACAESIVFSAVRCESALYANGCKYRLLVRPRAGLNRLKMRLQEFGTLLGESTVLSEETAEHWRCVAKEKAVEKLTMPSRKASS